MASPFDLVSLDVVKSYIGGAAQVGDPKVAQIITAVSQAIARYTDVTILPQRFTEVRDGNPNGIMLRNWPVISIESVVSRAPGFGVSANLSPLTAGGTSTFGGGYGYILDAPRDPQADAPQMLRAPYGGMPKGEANVTVVYTAGYQVTGEPAAAPAPSDGAVTVTVTAAQPQGAWGSDQGVSYASGAPLAAVTAGSEAKGAYSVAEGVYTFSAADAGAALAISYGYVPADIANAAIEWIQDRLAYQSRVGVTAKTLGGQETTSFRVTAVPEFVKSILLPYTNVVPIT